MDQVVKPTPATGAPQPGVAHIKGRIFARRRISTNNGAMFITVLKLPAPDQFTSPSTVEVRSKQSLGDQGEDVNVKVSIGGFGRSYKQTDPETGEQRSVQTADNTLTVVE